MLLLYVILLLFYYYIFILLFFIIIIYYFLLLLLLFFVVQIIIDGPSSEIVRSFDRSSWSPTAQTITLRKSRTTGHQITDPEQGNTG